MDGNCLVLLVLLAVWDNYFLNAFLITHVGPGFFVIIGTAITLATRVMCRLRERSRRDIQRYEETRHSSLPSSGKVMGYCRGLVCSDWFSIWYSQAMTKLLPYLFPSVVFKMSQIVRWNYIRGRTCDGLSIVYRQWYFSETTVNVSAWIINYVPHKTTDSTAMQ